MQCMFSKERGALIIKSVYNLQKHIEETDLKKRTEEKQVIQ